MSHPDPVDAPHEAAAASAAVLAAATGVDRHDVAVVLGSGWKPAADRMGEVAAELPMVELGGFPAAAVAGHGSTVRSIANGDQRVLAFMGRVHCYEGHHPNVVAHAVRTAVAAGCRTVVLTNAAGGLRAGMRPGQPVLIRDHLNLTGRTHYVSITDKEALGAFQLCCAQEGIIPALEPSHALAHVMKIAPDLPKDHIIVMNMCGRGDKDIFAVAKHLGFEIKT